MSPPENQSRPLRMMVFDGGAPGSPKPSGWSVRGPNPAAARTRAPVARDHGPQGAFIRVQTLARAQVTLAPRYIAFTRWDPRSSRRWKECGSVPADVYLCGKTPVGTSPRRRGL
jgi:hypothetical protein